MSATDLLPRPMPDFSFRRFLSFADALHHVLSGKASLVEAGGDNARYHVWSADQFIDDPEAPVVYLVRAIPRAYYEQMYDSAPSRMHEIQLPAPARDHLRLLA